MGDLTSLKVALAYFGDRSYLMSLPLKTGLRRWFFLGGSVIVITLGISTNIGGSLRGSFPVRFEASTPPKGCGIRGMVRPRLGYHINIMEMVMIWLALHSLRLARGAFNLVHSDNNIVVCSLIRGYWPDPFPSGHGIFPSGTLWKPWKFSNGGSCEMG